MASNDLREIKKFSQGKTEHCTSNILMSLLG